jgi:hypothetical protein
VPSGGATVCTVHPSVATAVGVGELARLESEIGAMDMRIRTDPDPRSDVAIVQKGGHLSTEHAANALIRAAIPDMGEGGAPYDQPVGGQPAAAAPSSTARTFRTSVSPLNGFLRKSWPSTSSRSMASSA